MYLHIIVKDFETHNPQELVCELHDDKYKELIEKIRERNCIAMGDLYTQEYDEVLKLQIDLIINQLKVI